MISCQFESGVKAELRHVVFDALCVKNQKILLVKRAKHLIEAGKYALPGGYLEKNETIKQGVLRELREESGYNGQIISLFQITDAPNRKNDPSQNVSFVFLIKALKKTGQPDKEVTVVKWFSLNKLPPENKIAFDH